LPAEWIEKFSAAMRYGKMNSDGIQLRKSQFALLDLWYNELKDPETRKVLDNSRKLLKGLEKTDLLQKPNGIKVN
jgi:hypothetical protein